MGLNTKKSFYFARVEKTLLLEIEFSSRLNMIIPPQPKQSLSHFVEIGSAQIPAAPQIILYFPNVGR